MSSGQPPGNGKGRRPRATTVKRTNRSPNRVKNGVEHPDPSVARRIRELLNLTAAVTFDVARMAHVAECGRCAATSVWLRSAVDDLWDALASYGEEEAQ